MMWQWTGAQRPPFADEPGPGQESIWDYPRPPRLAPDARNVVVKLEGVVVADTTRAVRVLETASPPTFYLPPEDVDMALLEKAGGVSHCEWKGEAGYWTVRTTDGAIADRAGWSYPEPLAPFESIKDYLSFYPARIECWVDGERVQPQPGRFYGGWITSDVVGPFKGELGTGGW